MAVPKEFQARVGLSVIKSPLGTADAREAGILAGGKRAELIAGWQGGGARELQSRVPSLSDLEAVAVRYGFERMRERFAAQREKLEGDEAGWAAYVADRSVRADKRIRQMSTGDLSQLHGPARELALREGWRLAEGSSLFRQFVERLATATLDAMMVERKQLAGEFAVEPTSPLVRGELNRVAHRAAPGESLLEQFDAYEQECLRAGSKRRDVLKQDRKVVEQFAAFVGVDRRVDSIMPADVRNFRDVVSRLPTRWRDREELKGLGMRDAADKADQLGLQCVSLITVNKYLSTVSPLFAWMIQNQWDIKNPCDGLFFPKVKGKNPRPPFTSEQLNTILASPLFTGFSRDGAESKPGNVRADDWRYWLPLLAMFTGARINELAQLDVADVEQHEAGMWFATIRHDEARGQFTKSGASRPAIVHSKLITLGFLEFVQRQRVRGGTGRLFPALQVNVRDQIGATPSVFWRKYLEAIGIKSGRDGFGAHSFRHTMADRLRDEGGLLDDQVEVALGHNQKTVTSGYGRIRQGTVPVLSAMVEGVTFQGVRLDHLKPI